MHRARTVKWSNQEPAYIDFAVIMNILVALRNFDDETGSWLHFVS